MSKITQGKERVEKLASVIANILEQDDDGLRKLQESGMIKNNGKFARGLLADAVGMGVEPATFRQNPNTMIPIIEKAEEAIGMRGIAIDKEDDAAAKTTIAIGDENEERFLNWLVNVGTEESPAPVNHYGRLYKKALWAQYSEQPLLEVKSAPTWFNSRAKVQEALEELDVKVVQGSVATIRLDAESIHDDMESSMTSARVRKLLAENKELREKLESEIEARMDAELRANQNELIAAGITTGKTPRLN